MQRKKPLTRKTALRSKAPMRSKTPMRSAAAGDEAVRKLWPSLAEHSPPFVQDMRLGPWRAEFACPAAKLVILMESADDPGRADWFAAEGWRVLSFAAAEAYPERVLDAVAAAFTLRVVRN